MNLSLKPKLTRNKPL